MKVCVRGCDVTIREGVNSSCPSCSAAIVEVMEGVSCPHCGSGNVVNMGGGRYQCASCTATFTKKIKK